MLDISQLQAVSRGIADKTTQTFDGAFELTEKDYLRGLNDSSYGIQSPDGGRVAKLLIFNQNFGCCRKLSFFFKTDIESKLF